MSVELICGEADTFEGDADFVLTNIYGPIPKQLRHKPMLVTSYSERHLQCQQWTNTLLAPIGLWERGRVTVWAGNIMPLNLRLTDLESEPPYFPIELPRRLLKSYGIGAGKTVWDGFCGRGTTGAACQELGLNFIGMDRDPRMIQIAKRYLGV